MMTKDSPSSTSTTAGATKPPRWKGIPVAPGHERYNTGYAIVVARCVDILIGGWIWRDYDITISAQTGLECRKVHPRAWARALATVLNSIEENHCELAITADHERAQQAILILEGKLPS
jgi:hypothetical protein